MPVQPVANIRPEFREDVPTYARGESYRAVLHDISGASLARGLPGVGNGGSSIEADKSRKPRNVAPARCFRDERLHDGMLCAPPSSGLTRGIKARVFVIDSRHPKTDGAGQ